MDSSDSAKAKPCRGMTLLELLVAITLTSAVILLVNQMLRRSGIELSLRGSASRALSEAISLKHFSQRHLRYSSLLCDESGSMESIRFRDSLETTFKARFSDIGQVQWHCERSESDLSKKPEIFFQLHLSGKGFNRVLSGVGIR